jgi:hypothetical protein
MGASLAYSTPDLMQDEAGMQAALPLPSRPRDGGTLCISAYAASDWDDGAKEACDRELRGGRRERWLMGRGGGILRDVENSIGRGRFSGTVSALFHNLGDAEGSSRIFF